jgi:hypothetical protein
MSKRIATMAAAVALLSTGSVLSGPAEAGASASAPSKYRSSSAPTNNWSTQTIYTRNAAATEFSSVSVKRHPAKR